MHDGSELYRPSKPVYSEMGCDPALPPIRERLPLLPELTDRLAMIMWGKSAFLHCQQLHSATIKCATWMGRLWLKSLIQNTEYNNGTLDLFLYGRWTLKTVNTGGNRANGYSELRMLCRKQYEVVKTDLRMATATRTRFLLIVSVATLTRNNISLLFYWHGNWLKQPW
jgi:hypothetical protein